jgi:hypothetical protein
VKEIVIRLVTPLLFILRDIILDLTNGFYEYLGGINLSEETIQIFVDHIGSSYLKIFNAISCS